MKAWLQFLSTSLVFCSSNYSLASSVLDIPLVNPGAESGDLTGWVDASNRWHVGQAYAAREGLSYFATDQFVSPTFGSLRQTVDVQAYTGQILDIEFSLSIAVDSGLAESTLAQGTDTWHFYAIPGLTLLSASGGFLYGGGPSQVGGSEFIWRDRTLRLSTLSSWPTIRENVASISVSLSVGWYNPSTRQFSSNPTGATVVDEPAYALFDDISLSLTIPEPSSALILVISALGMRRRMRSNER